MKARPYLKLALLVLNIVCYSTVINFFRPDDGQAIFKTSSASFKYRLLLNRHHEVFSIRPVE
jgi:hypothetical protein